MQGRADAKVIEGAWKVESLELGKSVMNGERFVDFGMLPLELMTMTMKMTKAESLEWRLGEELSS